MWFVPHKLRWWGHEKNLQNKIDCVDQHYHQTI